jgi:hypothetical protein
MKHDLIIYIIGWVFGFWAAHVEWSKLKAKREPME